MATYRELIYSVLDRIKAISDDSIITDNRLRERDCGELSGKPLEVTDREEYWNYYTEIKKIVFAKNNNDLPRE